MRRLSWIIWWAQCNHKDPYKRENEEVGVRGPCDRGRCGQQSQREHSNDCDGDGGGGCKRRDAGGLQTPKKVREQALLQNLQGTSPSNSLIWAL